MDQERSIPDTAVLPATDSNEIVLSKLDRHLDQGCEIGAVSIIPIAGNLDLVVAVTLVDDQVRIEVHDVTRTDRQGS